LILGHFPFPIQPLKRIFTHGFFGVPPFLVPPTMREFLLSPLVVQVNDIVAETCRIADMKET